MFAGSTVALVTPMSGDGSIDYGDLARLIDFHADAGTEALVIAGTTGESATLTKDEHIELIAKSCELAGERIPIIAGTGSNSTAQTLEMSNSVDGLPVIGFLMVTPYYNKPTQEGLYRHFRAIAEAADIPHILYNVPGRTVADMHNDTTLRLAQIPNIVGIKDATANMERCADLLKRAPQARQY